MSNIPFYCHIYWESYKKFHNWALMVAAKDSKKSIQLKFHTVTYTITDIYLNTLMAATYTWIVWSFWNFLCYLLPSNTWFFYFIKFFDLSTPDMIFGALNFKRPTFLFLTSKYVQRVGEIDILTYWYINMNM